MDNEQQEEDEKVQWNFNANKWITGSLFRKDDVILKPGLLSVPVTSEKY